METGTVRETPREKHRERLREADAEANPVRRLQRAEGVTPSRIVPVTDECFKRVKQISDAADRQACANRAVHTKEVVSMNGVQSC